jgi:hypothetical protein
MRVTKPKLSKRDEAEAKAGAIILAGSYDAAAQLKAFVTYCKRHGATEAERDRIKPALAHLKTIENKVEHGKRHTTRDVERVQEFLRSWQWPRFKNVNKPAKTDLN